MSLGRYKKSPKRSFWDVLATGVLIGAFGGFLIVVGMYLVVRERYTFIDTVHIGGNTVLRSSDIEAGVRAVLRQDCYLNISCEYGLWLPKEQVESQLLERFPRIKTVNVEYNDLGVFDVRVAERVVDFRFCLDDTLATCYFADSDSVVFERAPQLSDLRYIPTIYPDTSKITVAIPDNKLPILLWSKSEVSQYKQLQDLLSERGRIYRISYSNRDINVRMDKLYNYLIADGTAVLKFNRDSLNDPDRVMYIDASLDRLISFQPFASKFKVAPEALEYLDLRFPKRLYMKFVSEKPEGEEVAEKP